MSGTERKLKLITSAVRPKLKKEGKSYGDNTKIKKGPTMYSFQPSSRKAIIWNSVAFVLFESNTSTVLSLSQHGIYLNFSKMTRRLTYFHTIRPNHDFDKLAILEMIIFWDRGTGACGKMLKFANYSITDYEGVFVIDYCHPW